MSRHIVSTHLMTTFVGFLVGPFCSGEYCSYQRGRTNVNKGNCTELEHCYTLINFDTRTGDCPGNQCEPGWMGPRCQYVNFALNPLNSDKVFDGNMATQRKIAAATVNLNGTFIVNALIIHTSWSLGFLRLSDGNHNVLLEKRFQQVSPIIVLPHPVLTDQLKIDFDTNIQIKEIEVFGGKNVALWKSTYQSSNYSDGTTHFTSDKAVDGSGNGNFSVGLTCTHTEVRQHNPTWNVNLGEAYSIIAIKISNRNTNQQRINGFQVFGTAENGTKLRIYSDLAPYWDRKEIVIDSTHMLDVPVRAITIEGHNTKEMILTLCEVYVYACIPTATGTDQCSSFCPKKCRPGYSCKNGCPVCQDGWFGKYCESPVKCQAPVFSDVPHVSTDKSTYNYNEVITFLCPDGYALQGKPERICTKNGFLQPPFPNCSAIICQPPVSSDAPHILTDKTTYVYNETITLSCAEGYDLQGKQKRNCTRNGPLKPPFPNCTAIKCKPPTFTSTSQLSTDKDIYSYNKTIRFSCSKGFDIQDNQTRRCIGKETFQPPFPYCTAIICVPPAFQDGSHLRTDKQSYNFGDIIRFSCSEGFNMHDALEKTCKINGTLQRPFPNCTEVRCKTPTLDQKDVKIIPNKSDHKYNATIQFECKLGFSLKGSQKATCHQNASFWFIHGTPKCEEVRCRTPTFEQVDVMIIPNKTDHEYNSTILFECKLGFSLKGSHKAICHQNESFWFIHGTPKCEEVRCRTPTLEQKDLVIIPNKTDHEYNSTIQFNCINGLSLKGSQKAICDQNASFKYTDDPPTCEVLEEDHPFPGPLVAGVSVGSLAVSAVVVVVIIILRRKRTTKKPESKYYKNDSLSLDDIDHQYAEVNANKSRKNKEQTSNEQTSTYYNLNSPDSDKAKQARQEVYYEFSPVCRKSETALPVSEFKNYVESKKGNHEFFAEQFKKFYTGLQFPATAAVAPGNKSKNKYKNIYPYDETRVLLKREKGSSDSDFINASFIHGFGNVKSYIAAQGPLVNTIDDFWWMVWNEQCDKIVMLTNLFEDGKVKCIQYWPDSDTMDIRHMKLEMVASESFADFTIRTFNLINGKERRTIRQFHFTAWPDKGVPAYASSLVHFHSKVIHTPGTLKGPMVIHCSAGIGRTGTFIALNYLVQQAKESGSVDVFGCVETLRRQRLNMVQTLEQYKFLHDTILEALMCTSSDPSTAKFPQLYEDLLKIDAGTGKRNIDLNFENLDLALSALPESAYSFAKNSANRKKNRYSNILPVDSEMPQIRDEESNPIYINAVFLPAYKSKRSFIVTQMPLKDTVVDFWRLLHEHQVSTIVMLNQLSPGKPQENIGKYWPEDLNGVSDFDTFRITKKGLKKEKDLNIVDLCCHKEGEDESERKLRLFQCQFWPDSSTVPTSVLAFLKLINDVELHHDRNNSGPLVVHCMNGSEKSGLFCVMQVVLERMKIEQDVAIHHVIQQMRSIRPSIIPNVEQFKFCHDVVLEFLKQFDDYSNFQ